MSKFTYVESPEGSFSGDGLLVAPDEIDQAVPKMGFAQAMMTPAAAAGLRCSNPD